VPTNQQRREAAKRKLERQQQRREEQARRRRKITVVTAVVLVAVLVAGAATWLIIARNAAASANCQFPPSEGQAAAKPVSAPEDTSPSREGTVTVTLNTNQGAIPLTLDRAKAPCTVESFAHLARSGYFDGSACHRLTTQAPLQVLQCGDPTGQGTGGPGYFVPDEFPTDLAPGAGGSIYPRGVVAMANTGLPNSGGSQFFLVYADTTLPPNYTVFGTVGEPGLQVVDKVAAAGHDGAFEAQSGGGKPNLPVTIETATVSLPADIGQGQLGEVTR
jgi:peptidyl-prolyl cis-trans isomerase B (cyclophilin B)